MGNRYVAKTERFTALTYRRRPICVKMQTVYNSYTGHCKQSIKSDAAQQMILFDFPKAFGNIERDILRAKLYEAGLPIEFVQILRIGREENIMRPKCDGYIGKGETDNKGVSQGSPLIATLFIIYAERMIEQYKANLTQHVKQNGRKILVNNQEGEFHWAQYQYKIPHNKATGKSIQKPK